MTTTLLLLLLAFALGRSSKKTVQVIPAQVGLATVRRARVVEARCEVVRP